MGSEGYKADMGVGIFFSSVVVTFTTVYLHSRSKKFMSDDLKTVYLGLFYFFILILAAFNTLTGIKLTRFVTVRYFQISKFITYV